MISILFERNGGLGRLGYWLQIKKFECDCVCMVGAKGRGVQSRFSKVMNFISPCYSQCGPWVHRPCIITWKLVKNAESQALHQIY